ncbi:hypothetical protein K2Y11_17980 [bacterium]|nr:hypothetical protein [bacterium]
MSSTISWSTKSLEGANSLPFRAILSTWWFLPALIAFSLNSFLASTRGSLDGHEVLVAQTAREMVRSNDWIHPTLAGAPRYEKPPLAYWLASSSYLLMGTMSAFTARLPSVTASLLLTLLTAYVAGRVAGPRIGRSAGIIQSTMFWSLNYGSSAVADMILSLIVAIGLFAATADILNIPCFRPIMIITFWTTAGLAVLTKGPVGVAVMLATAVLFRASFSLSRTQPRDRFFLTGWTLLGLVGFATLAFGWGVLVAWTEPGVAVLWREQSFGRFVAHWGPQTRPWYYYLYQVPLLTLPWAPLWIYELWPFRRGRFDYPPIVHLRILAVIWFGVTLVLLSLSEGKREHYILPGLVPLSILAALGVDRLLQQTSPRGLCRFMEVMTAAIVTGALGLGLVQWNLSDEMETLAIDVSEYRDRINAAPLVIQYGSNEHASCFILDRPMKWCGNWEDVAALLPSAPESLLLVPASKIGIDPHLANWKPLRSEAPAESDSKRTLILLSALADANPR